MIRVEREIAGRKLTLETGRMAKQADGAVLAGYGDTFVLAAAVVAAPREGIDFFPLTVDYREKTYAAGKFPGGFFKREGRPTTKETLTMRLTDRSVRPLFPEGYNEEVQVMAQVVSTDQENDPDIVAMIAAFAALHISKIPFLGPLGAVRIGHVGGKLVANPLFSELQKEDSRLELVVAGSSKAIAMVEAGAKEIDEDTMVEALALGQRVAAEVADLIQELQDKVRPKKIEVAPPPENETLVREVETKFGSRIGRDLQTPGKLARKEAEGKTKEEILAEFTQGITDEKKLLERQKEVEKAIEEIAVKAERDLVLSGRRADGRGHKDIREISVEVGVLPRVHGSALFTRGETQALVVTTLGTVDDEQIIDGLTEEYKKRFLLHYNFPPFSVGEVKPIRGPSRREIGHGALAERSLDAVLPPKEKFPYTLRIVSDILESNGSSSMATVCGGTLSLMDAGVPIKQPVAGVAMGLIKEGSKYAIITDIQGSEDHNGDMDFKVAGTGMGITGLQMDIKIAGISKEILREALYQARDARRFVLKKMLAALSAPRPKISEYAPRLEQIKIKPDKIGLLIGPQGRNIKKMQEEYKVTIAVVDDTGLVQVASPKSENVLRAVEAIRAMCEDPEVGRIYTGRVVSVKDFGAFVEIGPGQEGLVHVSEWSEEFIKRMNEAAKVGDTVEVKVVLIDDSGKIKLSRKAVMRERAVAGAKK